MSRQKLPYEVVRPSTQIWANSEEVTFVELTWNNEYFAAIAV